MATYNHKIKTHNLPTSYAHDVGMSNVRVKEIPVLDSNIRIKEIPKMEINSEATLNSDNTIRIKEIPEIHTNSKTDSVIRIKEIPDVRTHLPAHYNIGIKILGFEIASFSLCGESQVITEKYKPNTYERCEDPCA